MTAAKPKHDFGREDMSRCPRCTEFEEEIRKLMAEHETFAAYASAEINALRDALFLIESNAGIALQQPIDLGETA